MQPRTMPTHRIPTRPLRVKGTIRSRRSVFSSNKTPIATLRAGYVVSMFPGYDKATYQAMHNALDRYAAKNRGIVPTRAQIIAQGVFDGLIDPNA